MVPLSACNDEIVVTNGDVYGIVTDIANGEPVRNAIVTLSPGNLTTITGNDGHYEFTDIESGLYKLMVSSTGYITNMHQISVVSGKSVTCDIALAKQTEIAGLTVSSYLLNFGNKYTELVLTLANSSSSGIMDWNITNISKSWLSVSETSGSLEIGQSVDLKVTVDRSAVPVGDELTFITVNANKQSATITIMISNAIEEGEDTDNGKMEEGGSESGESGTDGGATDGGTTDNDDAGENTSGPVNPTNGLYAYYMFEGNTQNSYGSAPDGIGVGAPQYVNGVNGGKAIHFDGGSNCYLSVPESIIDIAKFSISFWVKGLADGVVFRVHPSSSARYTAISHAMAMKEGLLKYSQSGYYWLYKYNNESFFPSFAHETIESSKWTLVTLTSDYNAGYGKITSSLYVNGQLNDTVTLDWEGSTNGFGTKLIIGGGFTNSLLTLPAVAMSIDALRIYKRVLTASEVKQIYDYDNM